MSHTNNLDNQLAVLYFADDAIAFLAHAKIVSSGEFFAASTKQSIASAKHVVQADAAFIKQTKRSLAIWVMSLGAQAYTLIQETCGALEYILPGGFDQTEPQLHTTIKRFCDAQYPKPLSVNSKMTEIAQYLDSYTMALRNYNTIAQEALANYFTTLSAVATHNTHLRLRVEFPNRTCVPSAHQGCVYTSCNKTAITGSKLSVVDSSKCNMNATSPSSCCCFKYEKDCTAPSTAPDNGIRTWLADPQTEFQHGGKLRFTLTPNMLCEPVDSPHCSWVINLQR